MKKIDLKSLLYKSFFKISLLPLLIVGITLLILYFGISSFIIKTSQDSLSYEINNNLKTILKKESEFIYYQLNNISSNALRLQDEQEDIFKNKDKYLQIMQKPSLKKTKNGILYKTNNIGASLFYDTTTKINDKTINKAHFTEAFDKSFKYIVDTNDLIISAHFNSYDNMSRTYPFISNIYSQLPTNTNMKKFNFYYKSYIQDKQNKNFVWTDTYFDPLLNDFLLSCLVPIYNNDFLEGVTGLDVSIKKFVTNILNLKLPWEAKAFLTNKDGAILAIPDEVKNILSLNGFKDYKYLQATKDAKLKPNKYNILKNEQLASIFKPLDKSSKKIKEISINSNSYILANTKIKNLDWNLYIILDKNKVFQSINELKKLTITLGFIAIITIIAFYIIFFFFFKSKVKNISKDIAEPISILADSTKNFLSQIQEVKLKNTNILEINTLLTNFNEMTQKLQIKTNELEDLNKDLQKNIEHEVQKNRHKDQKIFRQERFIQMGETLNMLAHQWRQPLNAISTTANNLIFKILLDEYDKSFFEKEAKLISQYSQELSKTIDDFRTFFKHKNEKVQINIDEIIDKTLNIIKDSLESKSISITLDLNVTKKIYTYPSEIQQVILNIIKNSEYFIIKNNIKPGNIHIKSYEKNKHIYFDIKDNGGGIDQYIINNIFDPYFTTKREKEEAGLGLYMSKILIEEHCNGKIYASSKDKQTIITVSLPLSKDIKS